MPIYRYRAVDGDGKRVRGALNAADEMTAAGRLTAKGWAVIDIQESDSATLDGMADAGRNRPVFLSWVSTKDVILFFRMFGALIASGITVSEAIGILTGQTENRRLRQILGQVAAKIEGGVPLSDALVGYPRVFSEMVVKMIRAGELGGILDIVLERISDFLEKRQALRSKMITTFIYPAIILLVAVGVVIFLVMVVIPSFIVLLHGRRLPWNTQLLLDLSVFMTQHWVALIMGLVIMGAGVCVLMINPLTRFYIDRYKIYFPMLGPVMRYGVIVQFARTFAVLLQSGINLVDALKSTSGTIMNLAVKIDIEAMIDRVLAGEPLSAAIKEKGFFPPMTAAMIRVGEHSGLMDSALLTTAELNENILTDRIARLSAMVEPALILTLSVIVGFVAWGMVAGMLAMYAAAAAH